MEENWNELKDDLQSHIERIDNGIATNHNEFHGSMVAKIIASPDNGVAKNANLFVHYYLSMLPTLFCNPLIFPYDTLILFFSILAKPNIYFPHTKKSYQSKNLD